MARNLPAQNEDTTIAADAASAGGPVTPATGTEGAAEAGEASAAAAPAEATAPAPGAAPLPDPDAEPVAARIVGPEGWELVVTGPAKGRWRAGRHFGPEPVVIPAAELTEDEARLIADDPLLTIVPRRIE